MAHAEKHNRRVWETFWQNRSLDEVYPTSERIYRQILALGALKGKWVMEIGAGSGRDGLRLAEHGARVIFLDYAESALKRISENTGHGAAVSLVRGDAFKLPFRDNSVDLIYHQGLLEHFPDPSGIIAECFRVLRPGGFAVADVPQKWHPYTAVKHLLILLNRWFAGWETEFTVGQLTALHRQVGFEIHAVYGDWMRPSFFYRSLREALKKVGIKLPLYPRRLPGVAPLRDRLCDRLRKSRWALYTYMDIGVVGRKPL